MRLRIRAVAACALGFPDDLLLGKLGWQSETYQLVWPRPSNTKVDTRVIEMIGAIEPATISGAGY